MTKSCSAPWATGCYGYYQFKEYHTIGVVPAGVSHTESLMKIVAHEMIHMRQYLTGSETKGEVHNDDFRALARRVCLAHGFDSSMFFI